MQAGDTKAFPITPINRPALWVYIPAIIVIGYVPLLVRGVEYTRPLLSDQVWFPDGPCLDLFLYLKAIVLVLCAISALIIFITDRHRPLIRDVLFIPLLIYGGFVIASAALSPYKSLVFAGSYEMFEGLPVIMSYLLLFIIYGSYLSRDTVSAVRFIGLCSLPGIMAVLLIGFMQALGLDIFSMQWFQSLIYGGSVRETFGALMTDPENPVFSTLYNADYAAMYFVLMTLFMGGLCLGCEKVGQKILFALAMLMAGFDALSTHTSTAIMALILTGIIILLLWCARRIRKRGWVLWILAIAVAVGTVLALTNDTIKRKIDETLNISDPHACPLEKITTDKEGIRFDFRDGSFSVYYNDEIGYPITYDEDDLQGYLKDAVISLDPSDPNRILINVNLDIGSPRGRIDWLFSHYPGSGSYYYINPAGKEEVFPEAPPRVYVFPDTLFTVRGLIWNHTLPTLPRHILTGSGANTYIMVHPQGDYIEEVRFLERQLDVKPHSLYLQQWSDHGLIALIALMVFIFWLLARLAKTMMHIGTDDPSFWLLGGCFLATCAYLLMGLVHDSNLCTSPLFWMIMAVGFTGTKGGFPPESLEK